MAWPVALAACTAVALAASPAAADPLPRVAHIARSLAAVRGLGPDGRDALDRRLYEATRTQCRADAGAPSASCVIAAGRAACAADPDRARCEAAADVIVTNLRAANTWVDEATRIRLVRGSTDYRAALAAELRRRYAALAAELVVGPEAATGAGDGAGIDPRSEIAGGGGTDSSAGGAGVLPRAIDPRSEMAGVLPRAIDRLCAQRDRALHACEAGDAACVPSLPWSRCVAALVWFVGGSP